MGTFRIQEDEPPRLIRLFCENICRICHTLVDPVRQIGIDEILRCFGGTTGIIVDSEERATTRFESFCYS